MAGLGVRSGIEGKSAENQAKNQLVTIDIIKQGLSREQKNPKSFFETTLNQSLINQASGLPDRSVPGVKIG
jgi:hypothetical protein